MKNILVIVGHPDPGSFTARLADAYVQAARGTAHVERINLADLVFDPILRTGFRVAQPLEPDLVRVREAIERADHVAWFFPTWWAAPPALVKGFIDRTFLPGWAFAYGKSAIPDKLLRGRSARFVTTMDSPAFWYALVHRWALHGSFVHATLAFVGFAPIHATTFYGVRTMTDAARTKAIARMAREGSKDATGPGRTRAPAGASAPEPANAASAQR